MKSIYYLLGACLLVFSSCMEEKGGFELSDDIIEKKISSENITDSTISISMDIAPRNDIVNNKISRYNSKVTPSEPEE